MNWKCFFIVVLLLAQDIIARNYTKPFWENDIYVFGTNERLRDDLTRDANDATGLVVNEIQVANADRVLDKANCYGPWIELYNNSNQAISLSGMFISDDPTNLKKYPIDSRYKTVPAKGFKCLWLEHHVDKQVTNFSRYGNYFYLQIAMQLEYEGGTIYISDQNGNLIIKQDYPKAIMRASYARKQDGGNVWAYTDTPTPGKTNNTATFANTQLNNPVVDTESGIFKKSFKVNVNVPSGQTLRFTTNGEVPTVDNGFVSNDGIFDIDTTTIIRFRLFKDGYLPSDVVTRSYVYDDKGYYLPIVSLVTDSANLYDSSLGILNHLTYSWERAANCEIIIPNTDGNYQSVINQQVDIKLSGSASRKADCGPSIKVKSNEVYQGKNFFQCNLFQEKPFNKNKVFTIRNGGQDNKYKIKDACIQQVIIQSGFFLDCQSCTPAHLFINGEFKGTFNLREPSNKNYAYANYGINKHNVDQFRISNLCGYYQAAGDSIVFFKWMNLAQQLAQDIERDDIYEEICKIIDIDEVVNYLALECFLGTKDWLPTSNNVKGYRDRNDGKFHLVVFDTDNAFSITNSLQVIEGCLEDKKYSTGHSFMVEILLNMLKYPPFAKRFVDVFCIVNGSVFTPQRVSQVFLQMAKVKRNALKWEGYTASAKANTLIKTINNETARQEKLDNMAIFLNQENKHEATISSNVQNVEIFINKERIPGNFFDGTLFGDVVIKVKAGEKYDFVGWVNQDGEVVSDKKYLNISNYDNIDVVATFQIKSEEALVQAHCPPIRVNEVSAGNNVAINDHYKKNDWIELVNTTEEAIDVKGLYISNDIKNPYLCKIADNNNVKTIIPPFGHLIIWADQLEPISQLHTDFKLNNEDGESVIIVSSDEFVRNNQSSFCNSPSVLYFADRFTYVKHNGNQTCGRFPDGSNKLYIFAHPTIGKANVRMTYDDRKYALDYGADDLFDNALTIPLKKGWMWMAHNCMNDITVTDLPKNVKRIIAQDKEAYKDDVYGMVGNLNELPPGRLFKVYSKNEGTFYIDNALKNTLLPIGVKKGWNWIGYTANTTVDLNESAIAYNAQEGETIIGQDGFAVYNDGKWVGTLNCLQPYNGYLLKAMAPKTIRFYDEGRSEAKNRTYKKNNVERFGINVYDYPNVMGGIAQIDTNPIGIDIHDIDILAYNDEKCVGYGNLVDGLLFLNIYGDGNEVITFKAIDKLNNSIFDINETVIFQPDVVGTIDNPLRLTFKGVSNDIFVNKTNGEHHSAYSIDGIIQPDFKPGNHVYILKSNQNAIKVVNK